jgi:hypothetical protein
MPFVVSCLAEGLLLVDGGRVERLDHLPSAGLAAGTPVTARALHDPAETATEGRILLANGRTLVVPGLMDTHELAWAGDLLACVSTLKNQVLWVDHLGRVVRRWQAMGEGDCWHLSGIASAGTSALVTAFGRFGVHRDWAEADRDGAGFVLELPSGRQVAGGFSSPHSPRLVDGALAVCDSGRGELVVGSRRVRLGGWTRGLAVTQAALVVGVSAPRGTGGQAQLAFVRRSDLSVARRVPLPAREVFDVAEMSRADAEALARSGAPPRPTEPLRVRDLRALVEAPGALLLERGAVATVCCGVTNLGGATLRSAPPHPICLVSSWQPEGRALWSPLPEPLGPAERGSVRSRLAVPARPGRYVLQLRLVQEGVAWLDDEKSVAVTVT